MIPRGATENQHVLKTSVSWPGFHALHICGFPYSSTALQTSDLIPIYSGDPEAQGGQSPCQHQATFILTAFTRWCGAPLLSLPECVCGHLLRGMGCF